MAESHARPVTAIACCPDGQLVASGSLDCDIKLWSSEGELKDTLQGHDGHILGLALSTDGSLLASADDKTVRIWNLREPTDELLYEHDEPSQVMTFCAKRPLLSCGGSDVITLWDPFKRRRVEKLGSYLRAILGLAFSPSGELLATTHSDNKIRLWDIKHGHLFMKTDFEPGHNLSIKLDGSQVNALIDPHHSLNLDEYRLQIDGSNFQMSLSLDNTPPMHGIAGSSYAIGFNNEWVTYKGPAFYGSQQDIVLSIGRVNRPYTHSTTIL